MQLGELFTLRELFTSDIASLYGTADLRGTVSRPHA